MSEYNGKKKQYKLPEVPLKYLVGIGLVSLLIHLFSYISIGNYARKERQRIANIPKQQPIKVNIVQKTKEKPKSEQKGDQKKPEDEQKKPKRIVETPMEPTEAPDEADFYGHQDHKAKKQTKIAKEKLNNTKGAKAGAKGQPNPTVPPKSIVAKQSKAESSAEKPETPKPALKPRTRILTDDSSTVGAQTKQEKKHPEKKARNPYEQFLANSFQGLQGQVDQGYQDYIEGDIEEGDRIDLNTKSYRYIGYFSNIRQAVELVWVYPSEAARKGIQGVVNVEFTIERDGSVSRVKVLKSSHSALLDDAIVQALREASPFPPLPETIKKESLTITGAFSYVLSGYSAGH